MKRLLYLLFVCSVALVGCDDVAMEEEIKKLQNEITANSLKLDSLIKSKNKVINDDIEQTLSSYSPGYNNSDDMSRSPAIEARKKSLQAKNHEKTKNENTSVNPSHYIDEGLQTARNYIEDKNYVLSFIKGEKANKNGNCDLYRLVYESNGKRVIYLAVVNGSCVTSLETNEPDAFDLNQLEYNNSCNCYNVGGETTNSPNKAEYSN